MMWVRERGRGEESDLWKGQEGPYDEGIQAAVANGRESGISAHTPPARWAHSGSAEEGGAAGETHDGRLELVVGVVTEGEEGHAGAGECVEEEVVAGIAGDAFHGGGGHGGEGRDAPGDVCDVVGDAEGGGVFGCGDGHVLGRGLETVRDMDGEQRGWREEPAEEEEQTGRVRAGRVGDGDGTRELRDTASERSGELADVDRGWHHVD
jgi:hypothetical protein